MTNSNAIVGIGEALLVRRGGRAGPGGLAAEIALHAVRLGRTGIPISRVGQDANGELILRELTAANVPITFIQTDPDLPTGRLTVRTIAGSTSSIVDDWAAFDNLQWDFDLEDVAQQTEAVLYGELSRRGAQCRTTMDRFLAACRHAIKVYDLTNRAQGALDRPMVTRAADGADAIIVDSVALAALAPGAARDPVEAVASALMKEHALTFVLSIEEKGWRIISANDSVRGEVIEEEMKYAGVAALLHGALLGWSWRDSLIAAHRYATFVREHPDEGLPDGFFERH